MLAAPPRRRVVASDAGWCLRANRLCAHRGWRQGFVVVSRLGDGVAWYALMAGLLVFGGSGGASTAAHLAATGVVTLLLYRWLKRRTRRPRPFAADVRIRAWISPLDEFSFPSGHTLHAVAFTLVTMAHLPLLGWILVPFTASIAVSRVVLGLHYPSDVAAAVGLGTLLAALSLWLAEALALGG